MHPDQVWNVHREQRDCRGAHSCREKKRIGDDLPERLLNVIRPAAPAVTGIGSAVRPNMLSDSTSHTVDNGPYANYTAPALHQMTDPAPTIGSLVGGCVSEGMIAMANRIVGPSAFVRFTGTASSPQRALASSGTGSGVFATGPLDKLRRRMVHGGRRRAGRRTRTCPAGENHSKSQDRELIQISHCATGFPGVDRLFTAGVGRAVRGC